MDVLDISLARIFGYFFQQEAVGRRLEAQEFSIRVFDVLLQQALLERVAVELRYTQAGIS